MLKSLNADFASAMASKQEQLDATQHKLRLVTRELAEQRQELRDWQARSASSNDIYQKIQNLEHALQDDKFFRWLAIDSTLPITSNGATPPTKTFVAPVDGDTTPRNGTLLGSQLMDIVDDSDDSFEGLDLERDLPSGNSPESLKKLQRIKSWQSQIDDQLSQRSNASKEMNAAKEMQYKQIVSICTGVPADQLDEVCTIRS